MEPTSNQQHIRNNTVKIGSIEKRLAQMQKKIDRLEKQLASLHGKPRKATMEEFMPRRITRKRAKMEVKRYYDARPGQAIYPDEVSKELKLDLFEVIGICEELVREGALA